MEQIFWFWSLLPSSVVTWLNNIIIIVGVVGASAGFLGRWIPFFAAYAPLCRVIGTILLVFGVYFKGGEAIDQAWRARVQDLQHKAQLAEERSKSASDRLNEEVKRNKDTVRNNTAAIKGQIAQNAQQLDAECRVSDAAIEIHNDAASNKRPKVTVTMDGKIQNAK
jgi:hypothetical protein